MRAIPKGRTYTPRLPESVRTMPPKTFIAMPDRETALCVRAYGKRRGWKMAQETKDGVLWMWRLK